MNTLKRITVMSIAVLISVMACTQGTKSANDDKNLAETKTDVESSKAGTIHLTKAEFLNKVMNYEENKDVWKFEGDKPCLVDFYATWCGPCKITSPILEELAIEYAGKINIYKVDTDKERELASVFGIQSIPSFLFCPVEGQPMMTAGIARTPAETKEMFKKQIDEFLLKQ